MPAQLLAHSLALPMRLPMLHQVQTLLFLVYPYCLFFSLFGNSTAESLRRCGDLDVLLYPLFLTILTDSVLARVVLFSAAIVAGR